MGLFDPLNEEKLSDVYPEDTPFMLYSGEHEGVRNTSFGPTHVASVKVGAPDRSGETKEYKVFGRLAEQFRQLTPEDLPALVCISKEGRAHVWKRVSAGDDIPF